MKKEILDKVFNELMNMPKEKFEKMLEEHSDGDIAEMMIESGAADIMAQEFHNRWRVECSIVGDESIGQSFSGRMSASKPEDEGSIPSCPANKK